MGGERRVERPESPDVVIGNYCHKYTTSNPLIRWLTERFLEDLDGLLDRAYQEARHGAVLEIGCGEGEIARRLRSRWEHVVALDLPDAGLRELWRKRPGLRFLHANAERLPFRTGHFDLVVGVEVLEHLSEPAAGLAEVARVARGGQMLLSVPREPLFRLGNFVTGRHVRSFGNTPGHLNHWSSSSFARFVGGVAELREMRKPFPWTMVRASVGAPSR